MFLHGARSKQTIAAPDQPAANYATLVGGSPTVTIGNSAARTKCRRPKDHIGKPGGAMTGPVSLLCP